MHIEWKPSIRRLAVEANTNPRHFLSKCLHVLLAWQVFNGRIREREAKRLIAEWQLPTIAFHAGHRGVVGPGKRWIDNRYSARRSLPERNCPPHVDDFELKALWKLLFKPSHPFASKDIGKTMNELQQSLAYHTSCCKAAMLPNDVDVSFHVACFKLLPSLILGPQSRLLPLPFASQAHRVFGRRQSAEPSQEPSHIDIGHRSHRIQRY
jgi:hypothetical protein